MTNQMICIEPKDFDESHIYIEKPTNNETKFLRIYYMNEKKKECDLCVKLPESQTFGIKPYYKFGSKRSKIDGYQIVYNENFDTLNFFDSLIAACYSNIKTWKKEKLISKKLQVKPVFVYQKSKENDKYVDDPTKPKVAYIKLNTYNNDGNIKINTKMYDNHSEPLDPLDYISKPGNVKPIIKIRGLYLGGEYAYIQFRIVQLIYKPSELPMLFDYSDFDFETDDE